jgi:hypothetical protein
MARRSTHVPSGKPGVEMSAGPPAANAAGSANRHCDRTSPHQLAVPTVHRLSMKRQPFPEVTSGERRNADRFLAELMGATSRSAEGVWDDGKPY